MEDYKDYLISIGKDALVAFIILGIILGSLYAYTGRWPPMVVIESSSMSHGEGDPPGSLLGIIDTGDIVTVKSTDRDDLVTYVEGKRSGHKTYGQYGDVIIYHPDGSGKRTPIIHRPVLYLKYNETADGFDIPSLKYLDYESEWRTDQGERVYGLTDTIYLYNYGYDNVQLTIDLEPLIQYEHSGYITMGDNNINNGYGVYDQGNINYVDEPIKIEWVEGKARGELPWFGTLKLLFMGKTNRVPNNSWNYLGISIALIVALPFIIDLVLPIIKKKFKKENTGDSERFLDMENISGESDIEENIEENNDELL